MLPPITYTEGNLCQELVNVCELKNSGIKVPYLRI